MDLPLILPSQYMQLQSPTRRKRKLCGGEKKMEKELEKQRNHNVSEKVGRAWGRAIGRDNYN
jgi:hypothetical protein